MTAILQFSKKSKSTFEAVAQALVSNPRYDFCVLKELSQNIESIQIQTDDTDQSMFFSVSRLVDIFLLLLKKLA